MVGADRDAFARSAYNRYYYSCYWAIRAAFAEMSPSWAKAPHKAFPEILKDIAKKLKIERRRAQRLDDHDLTKQIDAARRAIEVLVPIIEKANVTRIVADYQPEIGVRFDGSARFSLNGVEITDAHEWNGRVEILMNKVLSAWRQVYV